MSDEEINTAIAEERGWTKVFSDEWGPLRGLKSGDKFYTGCAFTNVPDYCNDLNAMREALELISQQCKDSDFWFFLREIIGFPDAESDWDEYYYFQAINATARQRAEAFLRTLGKWKE